MVIAHTPEIPRKERVALIQKRIEQELRALALEDLEDILNGLILARTYKSFHVPQELP